MNNPAPYVLRTNFAHDRGMRRGVSMPELMVVIGVIVVLLAILLPSLRTVRGQANMASSMNNMRQIATFMTAYSRDNRETILPSRFDYRGDEYTYKGIVRAPETGGKAVDPQTGFRHVGSWADIVWTENELGSFPTVIRSLGHDYSRDAPDKPLYNEVGDDFDNPLRSAVANTSDSSGDARATPHGTGAKEVGYPGFFAANDFFSAADIPGSPFGGTGPQSGKWWSTGMIKMPERSLYLVDSFHGEVIGANDAAYNPVPPASGNATAQIDFRYSGSTLMLMLDNSIQTRGQWLVEPGESALAVLEELGVRIKDLDKRKSVP